ncbi:restriction endonuclease subunit S [Desulfatirhabdium butyrativorans]|uniref:restriction endonuclease subunit S n=1 Tax=Desulfatirhabdium butyrativorans TaxID=340467 RepID=UPI0009FBA679|nr:restriction endonuclease subunit S [Desulfatirhabdium butyrativorans]
MNGLHSKWESVPLVRIVDIDTNQVIPSESPAKQFNYIALENIETGTGRLINVKPVQGASILSGKFRFDSSHVLFGKLRPYLNKVVLPDREGICSTDILPLKPKRNSLSREWLALCFRSPQFIEYSRIKMDGAKMPRLRTPDLKSYEIPLPPIDEQRRIVARIEELTRRAKEARKLAAEREAKLDALLQALYSRMIEGVEWKPLKEVASLVRRAVKTKPDGRYEEMGIRSFGKGTFQKPVLTSKQIGNKRIYTIHEGDLVFNNVFAWEKAIAVAKAEDHGRVGSHRFITYVPHEGQATSEFLCHHFLGERGIEDIRAASPGSAGRNRTLGLKKLEKILVPVPEYDEQKRFAEIAKRRQLIQLESAGIEEELKAFHAALLAKAFRGEL